MKKRRLTLKSFLKVFNELQKKGCIAPYFRIEIRKNPWGTKSYYLIDEKNNSKIEFEENLKECLIQAILNSYKEK